MQKTGVIVETKDGEVKKANNSIITAARNPGSEIYAFLLNGGGEAVKESLQAYGVHRIVEISAETGPLNANPMSRANAVIDAMKSFGVKTLLGLASVRGRDLLARIAAALDAPLVLDCIAVNLSEHTVQKSQFSGKTIATLKVEGDFRIYGIRPNVLEATPAPVAAQVVSYRAACEHPDLTVREVKRSLSGGVDLTEADIILSGGRGMENSENFSVLFECAGVIGAAVGASRVAVDEGWVPYSMQVGQTGKTVCPKVYIACGISGSVQHFAGMKTAGMIIAINKDPEAAIVRKSDYFVIADLFDIVPALTRQLKKTEPQNIMP
jgi:electron transfer flavoprotein alpha subunit